MHVLQLIGETSDHLLFAIGITNKSVILPPMQGSCHLYFIAKDVFALTPNCLDSDREEAEVISIWLIRPHRQNATLVRMIEKHSRESCPGQKKLRLRIFLVECIPVRFEFCKRVVGINYIDLHEDFGYWKILHRPFEWFANQSHHCWGHCWVSGGPEIDD